MVLFIHTKYREWLSMRKKVLMLISLFTTAMLIFSACEERQKTTVITSDIKQETIMQEDEVKKVIKDGINFLNEGKYEDARSTFEKAISMDKANKGAYIEIKNKYMEKERLDDAYYIIKTAINNNVDIESMKEMLNDIKSKFEVLKLDKSLYENGEFTLPTKVKIKINNEDKEVDVVWSNNTVDTSKVGKVKYEGKIEQYDREVELNLNVMEIKKENKVGYITKVYYEGKSMYVTVDEVEFYSNKNSEDRTAETEALKDGYNLDVEEGRRWDGYYIRNKSKNVETYEVSSQARISLCGHRFNLETLYQQPVSFEELKIQKQKSENGILSHIYLENGVILKSEEQFIP